MNIWNLYPQLASLLYVLWGASIVLSIAPRMKFTNLALHITSLAGLFFCLLFIAYLWNVLERPPMRTLGETRLLYTVFIASIGYVVFARWKYRWLLSFSFAFALLFTTINLLHPETYDKALMPALQSVWFVPHVVVYILAYALLGVSCLVAIKGKYLYYKKKSTDEILHLADNIIYIGFAFLTFGLLFGALWAKEAWGHYWTWDPKETWAFITWIAYLTYIHVRQYHPHKTSLHLWMLATAFAFLIICWFGINYLPAAQNSVHVYAG